MLCKCPADCIPFHPTTTVNFIVIDIFPVCPDLAFTCARLRQDYDPRWVEAFKMISDGVFGDTEYFEDLVASVNDIPARGNDWFLLANDFASYMDAQARGSAPLSHQRSGQRQAPN